MQSKMLLKYVLAGVMVVPTFDLARAQPKIPQVCFGEDCFTVDIANTPETRERGLMWRAGLEEGKGMFFEFAESDIYNFWMKNVYFPIDIIWMDTDQKVVHVEKNVPPCRKAPCPIYNPGVSAKYVLEISSGAFDRHNLKIGDKATLK